MEDTKKYFAEAQQQLHTLFPDGIPHSTQLWEGKDPHNYRQQGRQRSPRGSCMVGRMWYGRAAGTDSPEEKCLVSKSTIWQDFIYMCHDELKNKSNNQVKHFGKPSTYCFNFILAAKLPKKTPQVAQPSSGESVPAALPYHKRPTIRGPRGGSSWTLLAITIGIPALPAHLQRPDLWCGGYQMRTAP